MKRYILKKDLLDIPAGTRCSQAPITGAIYTEEDHRLICQKEYLEENKDDLHNWLEEIPEETGWEDNAIKSELAKVLIAPEDYTEGDNKHFTWEEACSIERRLGGGWRLPTRHEWALICEEFGVDGRGILSVALLGENLGVSKYGFGIADEILLAGERGEYWASTTAEDASLFARCLTFYEDCSVFPSANEDRRYKLSVRLVKDLEEA